MHVQLVDPSAFTPPYDRALAAALAQAGAAVELVTSPFAYGPVPPADGYRAIEPFYRLSARLSPGSRARLAVKLAEHVPEMLWMRRHAAAADIVHFQWLTVQPVDVHLLPRRRPLVLTAHDILPREPRPGQLAATRRLVGRMDAIVVHSRHGAWRLREELDVDERRVHVIPHGSFDYLTRVPGERPLPPELQAVEGPVVLFFGLLRPYKGIDVLLEAFRGVTNANLWIVGRPRMQTAAIDEAARASGGRIRFVPRFISDTELPAYFRRADLVVLPYREIDQSGVIATALAFGKPIVASAVGGFRELADDYGAVQVVPPGDPQALRAAITGLLADDAARSALAQAAERAARGPLSFSRSAELHLELYRSLAR